MDAATVKRNTTVITPRPLTRRARLLAWLTAAGLRGLIWTWRCRWAEGEGELGVATPVIFCIWHNRLGVAIGAYNKEVRAQWGVSEMAALISASRDGSFLAYVCEEMGIKAIRGSSSRRGPQALLEATTWIEKNGNMAITPDGPRGPVYEIQDGIIHLAQLTGRPIIPTSSHTRWKIRLRSWDRFQIPLPFARCEIRKGAPIWVPRDATDAEREQLRLQLQDAMKKLTLD